MIARLERWLHQGRRRFSRSEALIRLLRLPTSPDPPTARGLILVQIDGLSERELRRALDAGRLPFLRHLMARERYRQVSFYSGLPSSTPAVQGELFYGVRTAVPAFGFIDADTGRPCRMSDPATARRIEERLEKEGRAPLLAGGSAYGDIFSGGAAEAHFCASAMGWGPVLSRLHPLKAGLIALAHLPGLLRAIGLMLVEAGLALGDAVRGTWRGHGLAAELRFVPVRVGVSVMLRELAVAGASLDAARGLPVIHLNLLGYDEHAHRRGPSSLFAHWTLKGIDGAIARLWDEARMTHRRDYELWIYADHGQADATPFDLRSALERTLGPCEIAVLGRLGAVRLGDRDADRLNAAEAAVAAGVPMALARDADGTVQAVTARGRHPLPQAAGEVLGDDHPFLHQAAQDLEALGRHPAAGDLMVLGWCHGGPSLSFTAERGAHGGPAPEEVGAFALLPPGAPVPGENGVVLRPEDLRRAASTWLDSGSLMAPSRPDRLRVMTYNVHGCVGMDGRILPERIARVIATLHPDVVCLQEVDVERRRSGGVDQAHAIAKALEMQFHFHPSLRIEEEQYGTAVLSRLPMRVLRAGPLPSPHGEQRGAIKVAVDTPLGQAVIVATHLGVLPRERRPQVAGLLRDGWLETDPDVPLIACGDFNTLPNSPSYRQITARLNDTQRAYAAAANGRRPQATFPGRLPSARIDHVFVSPGLRVRQVEVGRGALARMASDHLPLVVDLSW